MRADQRRFRRALGSLTRIWSAKPETGKRVRQRIEAVLDFATAIGICVGDNPERWRGL
ncbi:phage integrase central domain-containing protein [Shimia sp.]|uniref:phage integrase central domain-containing protein n=1 Tax=Shimia sp. TaxID=1954381 RepID=UPI003BAD3C9D